MDRPKIICLCGSTRFIALFAETAWELEKQGSIVLGCHLLPHLGADGQPRPEHHAAEAENVKEILDELHLRKIDLADEVLVLNVGGYVGESTSNEIAYARRTGKPIRFFESGAASSPD